MRKILLATLFSLVTVCSYGQLYLYAYDAAGNRITRRYSVNGMSLISEENENEEVQLSKMQQKYQMTARMTDTKGEIVIGITPLDSETQGEITIYNLNGVQILKAQVREEETSINLADQPAGTYVLRVTVNETTKSWKIIKE